MATIAGTVMVLYASILGDAIPNALGHILIASIISAPAAITVAGIMVPETAEPTSGRIVPSQKATSSMDAVTKGTLDGLTLLLNIVAMLVVLVLGSIFLGIATPTEAAGIGAFGAFIFAVGKKRLTWTAFKGSLSSSIKTSVMVFVIILGAMLLGYFLTVTRIPFDLAGYVSDLQLNRYVILILILLTFMVLGCVIETMAIILLTVPIFFPLIVQLGFDPIWFGILVVRATEIGLLTPPVGLNVFVIKGVAPDVPIGTIFRGILPFLIADICHVAVLIAFPQLVLFLPGMMK